MAEPRSPAAGALLAFEEYHWRMHRLLSISVLVILLCCTQADAQARLGASRAGPPGGGFRGGPPGHSGRGFSHHHAGHRNFGTPVIYPYWPYYDAPMYDPPAPAPTVVVVPAERESPPATAAEPQRSLPPTVIELAVATGGSEALLKDRPSTVFVLSDGRKLEAKRYTITYTTVEISEPRKPVVSVPLSQLDVDATIAANHQRGIDLEFPKSQGELYLTF